MTNTPPRVSEKIETDAIEACLNALTHAYGFDPDWTIPSDSHETMTAARAQLARLKAAAALLRSYRAACGEHASTMVLVHRDEIDGVLG